MRDVKWEERDPRDFADDRITVTITLMEYRELCGKAALWDEYRADVDRWAGELDAE